MEGFSADDKVSFLHKYCTDIDCETLNLIKSEKISVKRAMKLDLQGWKTVGISYGEAVDIVGAIDLLIKGEIHLDREESKIAESSIENQDKQLLPNCSKSQTQVNIGASCLNAFSSSLVIESEPAVAAADQVLKSANYSSIEKFFTVKEWNEMDSYEKDAYVQQLENYEMAQEKGWSFSKPSFMNPKPKARIPSQASNRQVLVPTFTMATRSRAIKDKQLLPNCSKSQTQVNIGASCSNAFSSSLVIDPDASCSNSILDSPPVVDSGAQSNSPLLVNSVVQSPSVHTNRKVGEQSKSSEKRQVPEPMQFNDFDSDVELPHTSSNPANKEQATKKRQKRRRNNTDDGLSEEALVTRLPKFDINDILSQAGKKLKPVMKNLQAHGNVYGKERKLLMRTITKYLYYKHVSDIKLVTTEMKNGLAASLVDVYPLFKDTTNPKKRSWWRVFDSSGPSGFIANCAAGILRALDSKDRPRGGGRGSSYYSEESEDKENDENELVPHPEAEWIRLTMPWGSNKNKLVQGMETSYQSRRKWICKKEPSVTEILSVYPHLMSFDCELLEKEFDMTFPNKGHLFTKGFPQLVHSLKSCNELSEVDQLDKGENSDILGACLSLGDKLPRPNLKKRSRKNITGQEETVMPTLMHLLLMLPLGSNVQEVVDKRRKETNVPVQPYLLALVPQKEIIKLFIVADSQIIQLPSGAVLQGLDMLFKAYHVFNVMYILRWLPFWEMVENGLYQINPSKLTNTALEILKQHGLIK